MELNRSKPLSHYDFLQKVILAKLCPERYGSVSTTQPIAIQRGNKRAISRAAKSSSKKSRVSRSASTRASSSVTSSRSSTTYGTKEAFASNDSSLHRKRTNILLCHLPEQNSRTRETKGGKCCLLCRWATGRKLSAGLLYCGGCEVSLCGGCYKLYHTAPAIDNDLRETLQKKINKKSKNTAAKGKKK
jgi:ribosomal protein L37AE/L43A